MLGLNLNTNIPFSPVSEVMCHAQTPEDEVDAVTGMKIKQIHCFQGSQGNEKQDRT